jgi:tripartite-type tricarboxylate transporter receptor subunit TctC
MKQFFRAALTAGALCSAAALAQTYPTKPITLIYTTPPGGTFDPIARVIAARMEKDWGKSVVVESKPGAGGLIGSAYVARTAAPDGYTLLLNASQYTSTLFVKDMPIDVKELTGVSLIGLLPYQLIVSRGINVHNVKEFAAYAKANPGKTTFGAVAAGTHEVELHALQTALGINGTVVPFKGIAPIYLELIANRIDASISASTPPGVKTGEIIAIAVGGDKRRTDAPDVPTFREQGYNYDPLATYYILASSQVPRPILDKISAELKVIAKSPEFDAQITKTFGIQGVGLTVDETNKFLLDEYSKMKKAADTAHIVPQ